MLFQRFQQGAIACSNSSQRGAVHPYQFRTVGQCRFQPFEYVFPALYPFFAFGLNRAATGITTLKSHRKILYAKTPKWLILFPPSGQAKVKANRETLAYFTIFAPLLSEWAMYLLADFTDKTGFRHAPDSDGWHQNPVPKDQNRSRPGRYLQVMESSGFINGKAVQDFAAPPFLLSFC